MKRYFVFTLLAVSVIMAVSCGKKEVLLPGTAWYGSYSVTTFQAGVGSVDVLAEHTFYFVDDTSGYVLMKGTATMVSTGETYSEQQEAPFRYTFDGRKGAITSERVTRTFCYDDDADALVVDIAAVNDLAAMGVTEIVCHRLKTGSR